MSKNEHQNIPDGQLHVPKGFGPAANGSQLFKDAEGKTLYFQGLFPPALDVVDGANAPPTEADEDIYVLNGSTTSVHADWDGASQWDWVKFNNDDDTWYAITPDQGALVYDMDTTSLFKFDGNAWNNV